MAGTKSETIREAVQGYLDQLPPGYVPDPQREQTDILELIRRDIATENQSRPKGAQWKTPDQLSSEVVADIVCRLYPIVNLSYNPDDRTTQGATLALYQDEGEDRGIYSTDTEKLYRLVRAYNYQFKERDVKDAFYHMHMTAPLRHRNAQRNLVAVNNGIFDYDTKTLHPFNPDLVFTSKSKVDYVPNPVNPVIRNPQDGTEWDIESWMDELFDDPELTRLAWQIIGANIRPNVKWDKCAWFYSNTGENGKGTLCELMRQVAGPGTYASIPLANFSKDFLLEPLLGASSIICDENDVGMFIEKSANLKAIITNDPIQLNRKFMAPVTFTFQGFMIQCVNELPKVKDRSDSFTRRFLIVRFAKCFTGQARKYIKADYIRRKDVLEYVLHRVLHMDYYQLDEPDSCRLAMAEYKEYNDPIRQFINEILPVCQWDLLPYSFLYPLYKAWFKQTAPTGTLVGRNKFIMDLQAGVANSTEWRVPPGNVPVRPKGRMNRPEFLIRTYDLKEWMNQTYNGPDEKIRFTPNPLKFNYKGLVRISRSQPLDPSDLCPGDPGSPDGPDMPPATQDEIRAAQEAAAQEDAAAGAN